MSTVHGPYNISSQFNNKYLNGLWKRWGLKIYELLIIRLLLLLLNRRNPDCLIEPLIVEIQSVMKTLYYLFFSLSLRGVKNGLVSICPPHPKWTIGPLHFHWYSLPLFAFSWRYIRLKPPLSLQPLFLFRYKKKILSTIYYGLYLSFNSKLWNSPLTFKSKSHINTILKYNSIL